MAHGTLLGSSVVDLLDSGSGKAFLNQLVGSNFVVISATAGTLLSVGMTELELAFWNAYLWPNAHFVSHFHTFVFI